MKCPYQDIGCWHIDDVSHECEAVSKTDCRHGEQEAVSTRRYAYSQDNNEEETQ
jgi:hypothetical protein